MVSYLNILLIIEIIMVFAALMFIHELGHFIFAKKAGIFVREFSLGLGPKLVSIKKGETQYSLRILPFGAYVRMAGEDPEVVEIKSGQTIGLKLDNSMVTDIYFKDSMNGASQQIKVDNVDLERAMIIEGTLENGDFVTYSVSRETIMHYENKQIQIAPWDRQFGSKSIIDRFSTVLAGPVFNIILTIILLFTISLMVGVPTDQIKLGPIQSDSPAQQAGLLEGDVLISINNQPIQSDSDFISQVQDSPGKQVELTVERNGVKKEFTVVPKDLNNNGKGLIGVTLMQVQKDATLIEASSASIKNTAKMTTMIFDGFKMILTGNVGMNDLAGPVGIMKITSDAAKQGFATLMNWAAILSLYLGIFNLLPIPALDGSRLLFITIEGLRGRPIDPQKESMVHLVGFAFLMLLMIVVTVNDVTRIFN